MRSEKSFSEQPNSDQPLPDQPFSGEPFPDQLSLTGKEADVYEAIATLEFLGRPVRVADIAGATQLDEGDVDAALAAMTERGIVVRVGYDDDPAFEPAHRGWSAVPEQPAGPQR